MLLVSVILTLSHTACYDQVELEDIAFVQAIGFDKHPEGLLTTLQVGIPSHLRLPGTSTPGPGAHYATFSVVTKTALEALDLASLNLGRILSLVHVQLILFGEELAKSDMRATIQATDRFREIRGTVLVAVAKTKATDILRVNNSPLEISPTRFLQTLTLQSADTGLFPITRLTVDFANLLESSSQSPACPVMALASDYEPPKKEGQGGGETPDPSQEYAPSPEIDDEIEPEAVPEHTLEPEGSPTDILGDEIPKLGGGPVVMMGTAIFSGGKLVGYLTGEETRAMLMLTGDFKKGSYVIPDPKKPKDIQYSLGVDVKGSGTKVKAKRQGDQVQIDVVVHLKITYLSIKSQTDYTDPRLTPVVEKAIGDYIKSTIDRTVAKVQGMGSDVFGFGNKVKRTFLTWPEFRDFRWFEKFSEATVNTTVKVDVHRYGLELGPLNVPPTELTNP